MKKNNTIADLIEKNYGKGQIIKQLSKTNVDIESISTGSLGLDIALGIGGVPKGRIVEIYKVEEPIQLVSIRIVAKGISKHSRIPQHLQFDSSALFELSGEK